MLFIRFTLRYINCVYCQRRQTGPGLLKRVGRIQRAVCQRRAAGLHRVCERGRVLCFGVRSRGGFARATCQTSENCVRTDKRHLNAETWAHAVLWNRANNYVNLSYQSCLEKIMPELICLYLLLAAQFNRNHYPSSKSMWPRQKSSLLTNSIRKIKCELLLKNIK